ncbi:TolC family protein [Thiomicrospira microaerophila]|uniref:TolC family protein n=1 Tax=Thiomicrospira microaerophila TaxID=406020 RepID=UPI00200DF904|nr:TolC family protein [Thiomicrospira microaerophila]UQB42226.1 TolC family protein [Thiomicrospira microaerophila]
MKHKPIALSLGLGLLASLSITAQANPFVLEDYYDPFKTKKALSAEHVPGYFNDIECGVPLSLPSLTLAAAVNAALCRDPRIQQAWSKAQAVRAQGGVVQSEYLPNVNARVGLDRTEQSIDGVPSEFTDQNSQSFRLSLDWLVFDFGRKQRQQALNNAQLQQAKVELEDVSQAVIFETTIQFFELLQAQAVMAARVEAERLAQSSVDIVEQRLAGGAVNAADLIQVQSNLARAKLELRQQASDVQRKQASLNQSIGGFLGQTLTLVEPMSKRGSAGQRYPDLVRSAQMSHPKLLSALARLDHAREQLGLAQTAYYPSLVATAEYMHEFDDDKHFRGRRADNSTQYGIQLQMPIFTGFRNHYQTQRATSELALVQAEVAQVRDEVSVKLWQAFQAWQDSEDLVALSDQLFQRAEQSELINRQRYIEGVGTIFDWINAQENLEQARMARAQSYNQLNTSRIDLARASGMLSIWTLE